MQINSIEIQEIEEDQKSWDDFVNISKDSTIFHKIAWKKVVEKTYGHKAIYLYADKNDENIGVLPLFLMKSRLFGNKIVSTPFAPYTGVCAENKLVRDLLIKKAKSIAEEMEVDFLELRSRYENVQNLILNDKFVTVILKLSKNPDFLWNNFRKSMRRYVRKALNHGLKTNMGHIYLKDFYEIYTQSMNEKGTPNHSYLFFKNILNEFPDNSDIMVVENHGEIIGSILLLSFKDDLIYGWGASQSEFLHLNPNYLLLWESINYGCRNGFSHFDFGRSLPNKGTFNFKVGWGGEPIQLYYNYYLGKTNHIHDLSQLNSNRKRFGSFWSKLPRSVTRKVGPKLRKNVP
jgi:FemAB-related protein (PEP-CTERM system-associated)